MLFDQPNELSARKTLRVYRVESYHRQHRLIVSTSPTITTVPFWLFSSMRLDGNLPIQTLRQSVSRRADVRNELPFNTGSDARGWFGSAPRGSQDEATGTLLSPIRCDVMALASMIRSWPRNLRSSKELRPFCKTDRNARNCFQWLWSTHKDKWCRRKGLVPHGGEPHRIIECTAGEKVQNNLKGSGYIA